MIEVYSKDLTVASSAPIAMNNVTIQKGCSEQLNGVGTIQFNKCGVYRVSVDAVAIAGEVGDVSIQLSKDGVLQLQAFTAVTAADTTSKHPLSFETYVQVNKNNAPNCCCSSPVTISFLNGGVEATYAQFHVTVS